MHNITLTEQELFYITKAIFCYLEDAEIKDELDEGDLLNMLSVVDKIKVISSDMFVDDDGILN